jgi:quercetin dioxygenase-like cupin family protein
VSNPRYTYPRTIENGAGERLTFLRRVPGPRGDRLEGKNSVAPGAGPPMHVHFHQDEVFTVQKGRMGYQRPGQPAQFAGPGETVFFKAGEPHRFWNAGEMDLECTGYVEPADNVEYLLTEIFESAKCNGGGRPDPFDAAFLMTRYRTEYAMLEIPAVVQRFVFPALLILGKLVGRYSKYADAPEPRKDKHS